MTDGQTDGRTGTDERANGQMHVIEGFGVNKENLPILLSTNKRTHFTNSLLDTFNPPKYKQKNTLHKLSFRHFVKPLFSPLFNYKKKKKKKKKKAQPSGHDGAKTESMPQGISIRFAHHAYDQRTIPTFTLMRMLDALVSSNP